MRINRPYMIVHDNHVPKQHKKRTIDFFYSRRYRIGHSTCTILNMGDDFDAIDSK